MRRLIGIMLLCATFAQAATMPKLFYVYADKGSPLNHYIPSGWMGDYGDLKLDDSNREHPQNGTTAVKWTYSAEGKQTSGWAGCYWQYPANNWGDKPGGFNLTGYKRLTFYVRGGKGNEHIAEFKVGGITGEFGDSDSESIGPIALTKEWTKYTIDLKNKNLSKIVGAFAWSASRDDNPDGFTMFLDEIRFEK